MEAEVKEKNRNLMVSLMAENLMGSQIIKIASEINEKIQNGEKIYNLTIGDFNPKIFPIPEKLTEEIKNAYDIGQTNYPPADGLPSLKKAISGINKDYEGIEYKPDEILIGSGARPLVYALYQTVIHPGDRVIFPVPSWNNNYYCHLSHGKMDIIETTAENNFMPVAEEIEPFIKKASLISLCSPLNPTGTVLFKEELERICNLVLEENERRGHDRKPVYVMFDQIYWHLTHNGYKHYDPVSINPEMKYYTIFIDGISKVFAATGVRVGWAFGPKRIIDKMKSIISHMGAFAPRAEQYATAKFLENREALDGYISDMKVNVESRLKRFYDKFIELKKDGFDVDAISPQAAIYLTVKIDLIGKKKPGGEIIKTTIEATKYILDEARIGLIPFYAFGASQDSKWFRLSVGTCRVEEIDDIMQSLKEALEKLG
jgi:aspartate aminotransferase